MKKTAAILATATLFGGLYYGATARDALKPEITPDTVLALQETYYAAHGEYLQVKRGSALPERHKGTVKQKIGVDLPPNMEVHTYVTPEGKKGFQVLWEDNKGRHSVGYGPEAADLTWTTASATSTSI